MSRDVQRMFASIARRYDRANRVLSFGIDQRWRKRAVRRSGAKPGDRVLDLACGTGDLTLAFQRAVAAQPVVGADFTWEMLPLAQRKTAHRDQPCRFVCADAMQLPFAAATFEVASIAFGIRNVDDPGVALREMARVTKPGGRVVVLEFGQPRGVFGALYRFYAQRVMPVVGRVVTGQRAPYEYLPRTAAAFPAGERFLAMMRATSAFSSVTADRLTGGVAYVYVGVVA